MKWSLPAITLLVAISTAACGQSMKQPDIQFNPHPKMRYEITLTVQDAPGRFDAVDASVDYQVANEQCVPLAPVSGARLSPRKHLPVALVPVSANVFKGEFYLDRLADQDYYGLGVCRWSVTGAGATLRVGGTEFSAPIFIEDILAKRPASRFFSALSYRESAPLPQGQEPWVDVGSAKQSDFRDPASTFSTALVTEAKF
ncbi:MAG: hypothetical protein EON54_12470 [Alcaligenaceae bacterium]|nr:MAG: hypothetical protein EON54_12470 [Alcaligenaceae bacterium]